MSDSKTNGAGKSGPEGLISRVRAEAEKSRRRWPKVVLALVVLAVLGTGAGFVFLKGSGLGQRIGFSKETPREEMRRLIDLGQSYYRAKDYARAAECYAQATEILGNVGDPYRLWAVCLLQMGKDIDKAEELLHEAIARSEQDDLSRLKLAEIYLHHRSMPSKCLEICLEAIESPRAVASNRDFPHEISWIAAQAAARMGRVDDALELASRFAEIAIGAPEPCLLVAELHMNRWLVNEADAHLEEAENALERALQRIDNLRKKRPSRAPELDTKKAGLYLTWGQVHEARKSKLDARDAFEKGLEIIDGALGANQETKSLATDRVQLKVNLLKRLERYDEALKLLDDQYTVDPRPVLVEHTVLVKLLASPGDRAVIDDCLARIEKAKEAHPKFSTPFTVLEMRVHDAAGQAAQADERAAAAAEGTDNPDVWKALIGVRAQEMGNVEEAEKAFRQALEENPKNETAHIGLLRIAGNEYLGALVAGPAGNAVERRKRREAVVKGREAFEKALASAEAAVNPDQPKLRLWQGVGLLFSGNDADLEKAREILRRVINTAPNLADGHLHYGIACQKAAAVTDIPSYRDELLREAINAFRGLIAAERRTSKAAGGEDKASERSQGALLDTYLMTGQLREAILLGKKVVDEYPEGRSLRFSYATALLRNKDYILAEKQFQILTEKFPNWGPAWGMLGQSLYLQSGRVTEAEEALEKGLMIDNRLEVRQIAAHFFYKRGDKRRAKSEYLQIVEQFPDDPRSYFLLGTFYHLEGKKDLARETFEKGVEVDPDHLPNLAAAGDTYVTGAEYSPQGLAKAREYATRILMKRPGDPQGRIILARALIAQRELGEARRVLDEFLDEYPESVMGRALLASAMITTTNPDLARVRQICDEILQRSPRHALANSILAYVEIQQGLAAVRDGSLEEASRHFQSSVSRNPDDIDGRLKLAGSYIGLAQTDPAKLDLAIQEGRRIVKADPDRFEGYVFLGAILSRKASDRKDARLAAEAESFLKTGIEKAPKLPGPHIAMAEHHGRNQRWKEACDCYYEALEIMPEHIGALQGLIVCLAAQGRWQQAESICRRRLEEAEDENGVETFLLGQVLEGLKKPAEALASYRKTMAINPRIEIALTRIVRILLRDKKIDEALAEARKALEAYPESKNYPIEIGYLLLLKKEFDAALASFETAIERNPGSNMAYRGLLQSYGARGLLKEGAEHLRTLLNDQPKNGFLWFLSAQIQEQIGNYVTARTHYEKAVSIEPNNYLARNNLAWILVWHDERPELALEHAQVARAGLPEQPNVADTLAWIQLVRKQAQAALDLLIDPDVEAALKDDVHYQFHRARALEELGRDDDARFWLKRAEKTYAALEKPDEKLGKQIESARSRIQ
jgi:tetratricopeptide (TPR) repeat protein